MVTVFYQEKENSVAVKLAVYSSRLVSERFYYICMCVKLSA